MALQSLQSPLFWPGIAMTAGNVNRNLNTGATTLDAAGEYASFVFRATEAMTVSHVYFNPGVATGSPTIDVRIETVDATTGLPTGTLWATNTNIITGAITSNTAQTVALTASASIAAGDVYCVKFLYNSGTSVLLPRTTNGGGFSGGGYTLPYTATNTGTPTKAAWGSTTRVIGLGSSSTAFYRLPGCVPISAGAEQTFSTSSGDAFGNRFQVPFKCRCVGVAHVMLSRTGAFSYGLYNDAGTELSSSNTTFDLDQTATAIGNNLPLFFDSPVTLDPATWYRIALWPVDTTLISGYKWTTETDMSEAMPYTNFHYTTKASGGAWTDTATNEALVLDLIIDQLDDGVSTGGGGGLKLAGRGGLAG